MALHIKPILVLLIVSLISSFCNAQSDLYASQSLNAGQSLRNGGYRLTMQSDCNLVLYAPNAIWASNTNGRGTNCFVTMQDDGNLVIYLPPDRRVIWATGTNRQRSNAYVLSLQSDRNLVIYGPNRSVVWASNTRTLLNGMLANGTVSINTNNNKDVTPLAGDLGGKSSPGKT